MYNFANNYLGLEKIIKAKMLHANTKIGWQRIHLHRSYQVS